MLHAQVDPDPEHAQTAPDGEEPAQHVCHACQGGHGAAVHARGEASRHLKFPPATQPGMLVLEQREKSWACGSRFGAAVHTRVYHAAAASFFFVLEQREKHWACQGCSVGLPKSAHSCSKAEMATPISRCA
eukprot:1160339-Pelagomonas_calceolata.AAC.5